MRAKDRHSRIARTLGCLVVSMTVGAAVLDWVQPGTIATAKSSIGLMAPLDTGVPPWQSIHVVPHRPGARHAHFVVDSDGRFTPTEQWKSGQQLLPAGEIRISLIGPERSNDVTARQWAATRELLASLQQSYQISAGQVIVDDTLALPRSSRTARPRS